MKPNYVTEKPISFDWKYNGFFDVRVCPTYFNWNPRSANINLS